MLKSVFTHGGFWIGRYEAGSTDYATGARSSISGVTALSQKNKYPINYVTAGQAQTLSEDVASADVNNSDNYISSLMFGLQWNLVLTYLDEQGALAYGNCRNSYYTVSDTNVSICSNGYGEFIPISEWDGTFIHNSNDEYLLTTGAEIDSYYTETGFSAMNIYDLLGNVAECTLEHHPYGWRVAHGASFASTDTGALERFG